MFEGCLNMGFPAQYSGYIISKILVNVAFFLALLRSGFSWFLRSVRLADHLESESAWADAAEHQTAGYSASADLIRECLPVLEFGLLADRFEDPDAVCCAVCLSEFEKMDEVLQLTNCNHIFHKTCLDKWLDHDQKTCPMCRAWLMPETVENEVTAGSWAVERLLYLFGEDLAFE